MCGEHFFESPPYTWKLLFFFFIRWQSIKKLWCANFFIVNFGVLFFGGREKFVQRHTPSSDICPLSLWCWLALFVPGLELGGWLMCWFNHVLLQTFRLAKNALALFTSFFKRLAGYFFHLVYLFGSKVCLRYLCEYWFVFAMFFL